MDQVAKDAVGRSRTLVIARTATGAGPGLPLKTPQSSWDFAWKLPSRPALSGMPFGGRNLAFYWPQAVSGEKRGLSNFLRGGSSRESQLSAICKAPLPLQRSLARLGQILRFCECFFCIWVWPGGLRGDWHGGMEGGDRQLSIVGPPFCSPPSKMNSFTPGKSLGDRLGSCSN